MLKNLSQNTFQTYFENRKANSIFYFKIENYFQESYIAHHCQLANCLDQWFLNWWSAELWSPVRETYVRSTEINNFSTYSLK